MVEMTVAGLALDASNQCPIVLLKDPSGSRQVPNRIDHGQAHNIVAGIQKSTPLRPLTHDLMQSLLKAGKLELDQVIIHSIKEKTFEAVLKLKPIKFLPVRLMDSDLPTGCQSPKYKKMLFKFFMRT